jgi:hypothetical protein
MGDGVIIYDPDASLVHHLNLSASIVWHLCEGDADGKRLAAEIAEEYDRDPEVVTRQVEEVIRELEALGLVEDAGDGRSERAPGQDSVGSEGGR